MAKDNNQVSSVRRSKHSTLLTIVFAVISLVWVYPLIVVLLNSFKRKAFIFKYPFGISAYSLSDGWDKFV